jgi:circadian clock protein KaiB
MNTDEKIMLKLYIIKQTPAATETILKLKSFLDSKFRNTYSLDVIDILSSPEKAIQDKVMASPTLIKVKPFPSKRIVGNIHYSRLLSEFNLTVNITD